MIQSVREWMNRNELRAYPISETASRVATNGTLLPENLLADCSISFPQQVGQYAFVASVAISPTLASIVLAVGADLDSSVITPIAAVTIRLPAQEQQLIPVSPLYPGVGGWIAFGAATNCSSPWTAVFVTPRESLLLPRCARAYTPPRVSSLAKQGNSAALTGLVLVKAGKDVVLEAAIQTAEADRRRLIDGELREALVISIDGTVDPAKYAGPCGARPEQGTCESNLIQSINGVRPDCNGNITVEFRGFDEMEIGTVYDTDGEPTGMQIDYPLGLVDICGNLEQEYKLKVTADLCDNDIPSNWTPPQPPDPIIPDPEPEPTPEDPDPRYTTPWIELFDLGPANFVELAPERWSVDDAQYTADTRTGGGFVTSVNPRTRSLGATTEVAVWTGSTTEVHNPYLLFDYDSSRRYWYLSIDPANDRVLLGQRTGAGFFTRATYGYTFPADQYINVGVQVTELSGYRGRFRVLVNGVAIGSDYDTSDQLKNGSVGLAAASGIGRYGAIAVYSSLPASFLALPYLRPTDTPVRPGPVTGYNNDALYDYGEFLSWVSADSHFQLDVFRGELLKSYFLTTPAFEITPELFESDPGQTELPYSWRVRSLDGTGWSSWSGLPTTFRVIGGISASSL